MAALHQKQGRTEIAEGLYRKAASKCKDHVKLKKHDFQALIMYGHTLLNVAITAVAAHGPQLAEDDLQHALKVPQTLLSHGFFHHTCSRRAGVGEGFHSVSISTRLCDL
jgi:hypothetical protein